MDPMSINNGLVAPIGRASVLHSEGCRFESDLVHQIKCPDSSVGRAAG